MRIFHVSDLHFHRDAEKNRAAVQALQAVRELMTEPGDYLIVTGDITDDGHPEQYHNACAELKKIGRGRVFICPGNHDFGAAGNFFDPDRARRFDSILCEELGQGGTFAGSGRPVVNLVHDRDTSAMFIALDSNLETVHPFDLACGEIGDVQLGALDALLADGATCDAFKVVVLHHHPLIVNDPKLVLVDARKFLRVMHGRANVLAFGHKHESREWRNVCGIDLVVASDNTPGKDFVRRITLENGRPPQSDDVRIAMDR